MKRTLLASSIIALSIAAAAPTFAADLGSGVIQFNGVVNTGACTIAPDSVNKQVELGSVPVESLKTAGDQGPVANFALELTNCMLDPTESGTDFSKVTVTFSGQMDAAGNNVWASNGSANNVGVQFQDANGTTLKSGDSVEQNLKADTNTINLSARMQSLGSASAGTVKSTAAYVLTYQ